MDPLSSPRLGRRARYESFHLPPHFPDPKYSPQRHPPFASFPPHPAAPTPPEMPRNQYYEPRILHTPGDLSYFPSPHRSNPSGFDPRHLPFPRVSDRAIHRGPPDGKHLPPEILERGRGGGGPVDKPGVFDEGPDRFQPYDNFFKLGYSDGALVSRKRLESENDRFLGDDSEWKSQRPVRFWDERQSRYHDPILEQLPPVAAPLATAPPPFSSPRRLRGSGSVKNSVGEASRVFVHRHPPSSPRSFPDQKVVKNSGATAGNSQVFGNGPGPQRGQSIWKKKNNARDALPDRGFGGRQYTGHKSIKKSDPIKVTNEDGFWSSYHMVKKTSSIPSMDNEHEFEEDSYTGYNPKRKMTSIKGAKYNANSAKRLVQKPSAFSRIQSGLSVWERLVEKPLISSPPPPCSLPCSLPSPRASNVAEAKANNLDLSFESKTQVANVLDPSSAVPSSIEKDLFVENPNRVMKNKNTVQTREKVIFPIVSSSPGPSRNCNRVMKKKTNKKMIQTREKVVIPIVTSSPGSIAKQLAVRNYNVSSLESVSVLPEAKKAEISSCMPGGKSMPSALTTKGKKLAMDMKSGAEEAAKMSGQVDGCIIETPRMEDAMETPKYEGVINRTKQIGNFTRSGDTGTEPINDNHLQICQKIDMMLATPTNNVGANIISTGDDQAQDTVIGILGDGGEESLELSKKSDSICQRSLDFDVNVCSQPSEYIIDNLPAQDSLINRNENDAANSIKQIESVNSPHWEIGQDIPPPDDASPVLLGAGEVFVSAGSRTADTDTSPKSSNAEIEFERELKHREKMVFITDSEELEVPGNYASSQCCIHGLQAPSFSEVSNSAPELKLLSEGTVKEDNILPQSVCNMTFRDSLGTLTNDSYGEGMGQALLLEPMEMDPPATVFENVSHSNPESSESMDLSNNAHSVIGNPEHGCQGEAFVSFMVSRASEPGHESGKPIKNHQLIPEKPQLLPSHELKKQVPPNPKLTDKELSCKETSALVHFPRFSSDRLNFSVSLKEATRASQTGKHKTWLRTKTALRSDENTKLCGILSKQVPRKLGKIQNSSYFRKGNSLIRKLAPEPPSGLLHTAGSSSTKVKSIAESSASEIRSECPDSVAPSYPLFERSKTPPLPLSNLSGFTMTSSKDFPQPIPMDRSPEPDTDQGNQHDSQSTGLFVCDLESSQDSASFKTVEVVNAKKVTYVKRKTNQLVAAPGPEIGDSSKFLSEQFQKPVHHPIAKPKTMSFSSCLYHRSKRNQLIRNATSSDNKLTGVLAVNTNSVDSLKQGKTLPYKKRLDNVRHKEKRSTSSLVWTLGGDKLSKKCIATFGCQSVLPYIFPWKRAVNWMTFMTPNNIPNSSRSSVSLISRKLQCLRKRDTIYKVSTNGFSLRKAGVVSIGGSSLKWSKSIEKRSKKASEEATLAVAEVEREKREKKGIKSTCGNGKNKVSLTGRSTSGIELKRGERIFRVGSARYKMDASMRTLLRIPDDHPSSASQQPGNSSRISFIPRRLIIGNNEYVRIGNGNQLVRDPKKLKRILANEKVRWSLHSARLRLAQKRQYCLFFTRFGKCNKRGRKCPYIHDPTKVAICTKFLKGQCFDTDCKLTHKVIPERMPDCSYFLKGLCTNINCPYRHVKVNANAPLCDGFLRGHCADGDECRKKHSYTCPLFEATGICPQGSLCKLHHRKNQSKSRKRKRTKIENGSQGRYFYSSIGTAGEPLGVGVPSSQNDLEGSSDIFCSVGQFTEYINLDVDGDNFAIENDESDSGYHDWQSCDMDDLIKPVRIMNSDDLTIF